ncbi:MAG: diacylglycerol kinase family protein [Undibacterium sp.]
MHKFFRSLRHAVAGVLYALREERNFHLELATALVVAFFAWYFPLSSTERAVLFLACGLVLSLELVNTSLERVLDMMKPRVHPYVRVIKDLVAGAVLIGSIGSGIAGAIILFPYFF